MTRSGRINESRQPDSVRLVSRFSLRIIMNLVLATIACFIAFAGAKNVYIPTLLSRLTISTRLSNAYLIGPNVTTQRRMLVYDAYTRERSNHEEVLNVARGSNVYKKPSIVTQIATGNIDSLLPRAWPWKADAASPIPEHSIQTSRDEALGERVNNQIAETVLYFRALLASSLCKFGCHLPEAN